MALTEAIVANKLQVAIAGLVVLGGGGATYAAMGGDVPFLGGASNMVDTVPEDVDLVVSVNAGIKDDEATTKLVEGMAEILDEEFPTYGGPNDTVSVLQNSEMTFYLDPAKFESAVIFGRYPDRGETGSQGSTASRDLEYVGMLVDSQWSERALVKSLRNRTEYTEETYHGATVYVESGDDSAEVSADGETSSTPAVVGVLGDGQYVFGSEDAVEDAIDVQRGAASAFGGDLRSAYAETQDGTDTYLQYAFRVPDDWLSAGPAVTRRDGGDGPMSSVDVVAGSYYAVSEDELGMQFRLKAGSASDADDVESMVSGGVALAETRVDVAEVESLLSKVEVTPQGTDVVVTFETPVSDVLDAFEAVVEEPGSLLSLVLGGGFSASTSTSVDSGVSIDGSSGFGSDGGADFTTDGNADFAGDGTSGFERVVRPGDASGPSQPTA